MGFFNSFLSFAAKTVAFGLLALGALISGLNGHVYVQFSPATSSAPLASEATSSPHAAQNQNPAAPTTPTASAKPAAKALIVVSTATAPPVAAPTLPAVSAEQVNIQTRAALVNILCTTQAGGSFSPISGSGIIIDSRGIVLTNAHVGQFFLLRDYLTPNDIICVLRTGSPAVPTYTATLMYLPPAWISANASQITAQQESGTGENDYAFLLITGSTNPGATLPASFSHLALNSSLQEGEQVLLAAYPAGFLDGETIQENLYLSSALTAVQQLYTFDNPAQVDAIGVGGTVVSQSGSSGGAVVSLEDGSLIGIISTETASSTTAGRELDAITIAHINRSLASQDQGGIVQLLSQDPSQFAANFASTTAPQETRVLEAVLNKAQN